MLLEMEAEFLLEFTEQSVYGRWESADSSRLLTLDSLAVKEAEKQC